MFERYTERARRVIFFSRYEASQFGSTTIETEHFLLGLIREDKNLTKRFLGNQSAIESIRKGIEEQLTIRDKVSTSIDLPLSNKCKRILAYAAEEAQHLNHRHIGTEHLLLGVLREEACVAAKILYEHGLRPDQIREELTRSAVEPQPESVASQPSWVSDAETAVKIAEAILTPIVGVEAVEEARPWEAFAAGHHWVVRGAWPEGADERLTALIERSGRIAFAGKGSLK
jgi:ATP-dependent Clp protease ATP-binding subunit ClpA